MARRTREAAAATREQLLDATKEQDERIGELESQLEGERTRAASLSTDVASHAAASSRSVSISSGTKRLPACSAAARSA